MQALDFAPWLEGSVEEVLGSMCFLSVLGMCTEDAWDEPAIWMSGRVDFRGACRGSFGIGVLLGTARLLAANFLGEEDTAPDDVQAAEVVGEVANMICGALLQRVESKLAFSLASPVCGFDAPAIGAGRDRISRTFELDEGVLHAWMEIGQPQ